MGILGTILAALAAYLGIFFGFALAYIAKEEMANGKKYLMLSRLIFLILFLALALISFFYKFDNFYLILAAVLFVFFLLDGTLLISRYARNKDKKQIFLKSFLRMLLILILLVTKFI